MGRITLFLVFVLSACSLAPQQSNTLVVGIETDVASLDPRYAFDAVSANVCRLVYAGIMRRDEKMALRPWLAESVAQPDPTTYVIRLRKNAAFNDGRPLTSADLRYTINSVLDEKNGSPLRNGLGDVVSVATPDAFTVVVKLREPFAPFVGNLTFGVVPDGSGDLSEKPAGAGPFRVVRHKRGAELALARNDFYFGEPPRLSGVLFKTVPDETVRMLELSKGNLHLVSNPIMPAMLPWLGRQKSISLEKTLGTNVSYIGFNARDPVLRDVRVRRAIAHAIDRDAIIKHFLRDSAVKTETLIAPANPFHMEEVPLAYDPEKSRQLLDAAGHPDPGGGRPRLKLVFKTSKNAVRGKLAEIFAEHLKKVGIETEIKSYEWGTFFSDVKSGNFQMYSLTWVGIADPDVLRFIFHSKYAPPNGFNRGRFEDPELDELLDAGKKEPDFSKRKKIYDEAQRELALQLPFLPLWTQVNVAALNRRVSGFVVYPDEGLDSLATARFSEGEK
ncbi:MAG: ABC transporter substrate-binding protein [Nitrospinae bacterium]|nr:ABC transporter substrate-binding protein [Nitrospinota bacterium]